MSDEEKKLVEIIEGSYRKPNEPVNIDRLIKIVEKLDELEAQHINDKVSNVA